MDANEHHKRKKATSEYESFYRTSQTLSGSQRQHIQQKLVKGLSPETRNRRLRMQGTLPSHTPFCIF